MVRSCFPRKIREQDLTPTCHAFLSQRRKRKEGRPARTRFLTGDLSRHFIRRYNFRMALAQPEAKSDGGNFSEDGSAKAGPDPTV